MIGLVGSVPTERSFIRHFAPMYARVSCLHAQTILLPVAPAIVLWYLVWGNSGCRIEWYSREGEKETLWPVGKAYGAIDLESFMASGAAVSCQPRRKRRRLR
jgi:hypothetical protein